MLKSFVEKYRPKVEAFLSRTMDEEELDRFNNIIYKESARFILSPGKRLRPIIAIMAYESITGKEADTSVIEVSGLLEFLHAYLLIHDDIIDRDEIRRGQPTVWRALEERVPGVVSTHQAFSLAILAGDIVRARMVGLLEDIDIPDKTKWKIVSFLSKIDEYTNRGQVLDVSLSFTPISAVSEKDILNIYLYKTAYYSFYGPLGIGAILAGEQEDTFKEFALNLGIAFQIKDDILGVFGDPNVTGKPADSDIKEGKRTLLLWYAWNHSSREDRAFLENVIGREDSTEEEVEEVRNIMRRSGALEYANIMAEDYLNKSLEALERLNIKDDYRELFRQLAHYIVAREK